MAPKFVDKDQKAKEIGGTALQLYIKKGYAATSVGEIADAAGIGKGTIYEYFNTKGDIFVAAIQEWSAQAEVRYQEILERSDDPIRQLNEFVALNMEVFDPDARDMSRLFIEMIQQTFIEGGAFYNKHHLVKELTASRFRIVVEILLNGISKGIFRPEIAKDVEKIAVNLISFLRGVGLHSMITEKTVDAKEQIDFFIDRMLEMISVKAETRMDEDA